MSTPETWSAVLTPRLPELLPEYAGQQMVLRPVGGPRTFTYSRLLVFEVVAGGQTLTRLALKEPFGSLAADPAAEFAALQTLHRHFTQPGLRVPRPLLALDSPPCLLMEAISGMPLQQLLAACRRPVNGKRLQAALACAARAGGWLALLHRLPPPAGAQPAPTIAARVEESTTLLAGLGMAASSLMSIRNALLEREAEQGPTPVVILHGDYTPRNVFGTPEGGVVVFDTALSQTGSAAYDLGWFLAGLAFLDRWQMLFGGRVYDHRALTDARQAFLAGYQHLGPPTPSTSPETLSLYTAVRLLQRWAQYAGHLHRTQPLAARVLLPSRVHPYFRGQIEALLRS